MRRWARLLGINVAVFLGIFYVLNTLSALALDLQYQLEALVEGEDKRASLSVYTDKEQARVIYDEFQQLRTGYAPYVAWSRKPFAGEAITIDEAGDRVHRHSTETPSTTVRFFGGSTVWGSGVADSGTLPALFDQRFEDVVAYNHGESAFMSRQDLARLINLVNQDEPMDWVVFYGGYNDAQYRCLNRTPNGHARERRLAKLVEPGSHVVAALAGPLIEVVDFLRAPFRDRSGWRKPCVDDPEYVTGIADTLLANWRIAREVARLGGANFLAVFQPMAGYGEPNVEHLKMDSNRLVGLVNAYRAIHRAIRAADEPWIVDLTDIFDGETKVYVDYCHVGAPGNQVLADAIAQSMLEDHGAKF